MKPLLPGQCLSSEYVRRASDHRLSAHLIISRILLTPINSALYRVLTDFLTDALSLEVINFNRAFALLLIGMRINRP